MYVHQTLRIQIIYIYLSPRKKKKKESIEHKTNEDRNPRDTSDLWMGQTGPRKQTNKG